MPKRFSLIDCADKQVLVSGAITPDTLPEVPEVLEVLSKTSNYEKIDISITEYVFVDYLNTPITDATEEEMEVLSEDFQGVYDKYYNEDNKGILRKGLLTKLTLQGLKEEEIVDGIEMEDINKYERIGN